MSSALPPRPMRLSPLAADGPHLPFFPNDTLYAQTPGQTYVNVPSPMSQISQTTGASNRFYGGASSVSHNGNAMTGSSVGRSILRKEYQSETLAGQGFQRTVNESVVSGNSTVVAGSVVGERVTERRIRVPKRIVREDLYEKVIVIPERRLEEEIVETEQIVREKIVEIAKPVIQQKFVDVVEVEYRDKIIEVPEIRVEERITRVPRLEWVERVQRVPKIIRQEKIVEVPHTEYREIPVVKRVEVPQIQEEIVLKERPVTVYVDKPVPEYIDVAEPYDVHIKVPVPVAAEMVCDYEVPQLEQVVQRIPYNIYVPKFVQVPVARAMLNDFWAGQATKVSNHIALLTDPNAAMSLAEVEKMAADINNRDPVGQLREHLEREGMNNFAARYVQGGFEVHRAHDFVGAPQFHQAAATSDMREFEVQYRGTQKKSRGRAGGGGRNRRKRSASHDQKSLWERLCPEWLLDANAGARQQASCHAAPGHRSPRHRVKASAQPVSFGGAYPTLRPANSRPSRNRRYSADSNSSGTSYCTSCSECNAQRDIMEASIASRRR